MPERKISEKIQNRLIFTSGTVLDAVKGSDKEEVSDQDTKPEHNMLRTLPIIPSSTSQKIYSLFFLLSYYYLPIILILFFLL